MAFEAIYVWNNTSIMQDEVLCHRIGLVPIKVDPRRFTFKEGSYIYHCFLATRCRTHHPRLTFQETATRIKTAWSLICESDVTRIPTVKTRQIPECDSSIPMSTQAWSSLVRSRIRATNSQMACRRW